MSKPIKIMVVLVLAALSLTSCEINYGNLAKVTSRDKVKHEETTRIFKNFKPFERIVINSVCKVSYEQGDTFSVIATGKKSELESLIVTSDNGELTIDYSTMKKLTRMSAAPDIRIAVVSPDLIGVEMRGAGQFKSEHPVDTDTLRLTLKGAGVFSMGELVCDRLIADLRGAGTMNLENITTQSASLELKGVGLLQADFESCGDVAARLTGVGTINVDGNVKRLSKRIHGTGSINDKTTND
ncbi:MAG: DUF2807 domain-containing protein [Prevotella sp.]|nr:DUF2807 domain-containing protein [Prevotella sp.]